MRHLCLRGSQEHCEEKQKSIRTSHSSSAFSYFPPRRRRKGTPRKASVCKPAFERPGPTYLHQIRFFYFGAGEASRDLTDVPSSPTTHPLLSDVMATAK